jgi:hypothetical protein
VQSAENRLGTDCIRLSAATFTSKWSSSPESGGSSVTTKTYLEASTFRARTMRAMPESFAASSRV